MKRLLVLLVTLLFVVSSVDVACAKELDTSAQSYVLYCVENSKVLSSSNMDKKMKMASTTKLMTTLITLEHSSISNEQVMFKDSMIAEGSSMYLKIGDTLHLYDLAVGMMMCSGNDAANAAAVTIGGSIEGFADIMNKKAKTIGMKNTHFVTPSGLDDDNHYSTAYDMSLLMAYALENEDFKKITKSKSMSVDFVYPEIKRTYQNHNRLLSMYEYCIGGKTGYTQAAGRCLVSAAYNNGITLVCVTLNDHNDWDDHLALYEYGFSKYCGVKVDDSDDSFSVDVVGSDKDKLQLYCEYKQSIVVDYDKKSKVTRTVYLPQFVYAPIKKGDHIGTVVYSCDNKTLTTIKLYAKTSCQRVVSGNVLDYIRNLF